MSAADRPPFGRRPRLGVGATSGERARATARRRHPTDAGVGPSIGDPERAAARRRHPTARAWAPDRARLAERLAGRARARGAPWPRVAAAVVLLRGVAGDDPPTFAARVGLTEQRLARLEAGLEPPAGVPATLRSVEGLVDWRWVDAGPAG